MVAGDHDSGYLQAAHSLRHCKQAIITVAKACQLSFAHCEQSANHFKLGILIDLYNPPETMSRVSRTGREL